MQTYIAFLRAINIGGRVVKMERLRALFESLGFADVTTFIASGNVIFKTNAKDSHALERKIEQLLHKSLGYEVTTFLRTNAEVFSVATYKPFSDADLKSAQALNVGFLTKPLDKKAWKILEGLETDIDAFHTRDREFYWLCKKKQSESTFSNARFEKATGQRATFRGINTILRLSAKYQLG